MVARATGPSYKRSTYWRLPQNCRTHVVVRAAWYAARPPNASGDAQKQFWNILTDVAVALS